MIRGRADGRGKDEVEVSRLRSIKSAVMSEESPYPALSTRRCAKEPAPRNLRLADPNLTLTRTQCPAMVDNTGAGNSLPMRDLQDPATLSNHWPHTRNEQISGSSPLVGSLFFSRFAAKSLDLEGSLRSEKGAIYCNCTATQSRFFHEARSNRFRLTTAGPLRADATDLVAWANRQRARVVAAGPGAPIGTGFGRPTAVDLPARFVASMGSIQYCASGQPSKVKWDATSVSR
jgi:hypothetical protein